MDSAVGLTGWVLAAVTCAAVAIVWRRLCRHSEAVARACHELRGPLTAARLGLELGARLPSLPPRRLRAIELELGRATLALDDLSRTDMTPGRTVAQPVDLTKLAADCTEAWQGAAAELGVRLQFRTSSPGGLVTGDRLRLAQAIGNLVANAIEHGGEGVEVSVRAEAEVVRLEVLDGGPGLPVSLDRLSRPPRRWRRPGARGHGLAIVSAVAAAHGGRLAAAPSDRGARLVLELPGEILQFGRAGLAEGR